MDIDKIKEFLDSEEGVKSIEKWFSDQQRFKRIGTYQRIRTKKFIKKLGNIDLLIDKLNTKYRSDEYVNRWYSRGIEPPNTLYWVLFEYASYYGVEVSDQEYQDYGSDFTSEMYSIHGYYFSRDDGQGSWIHIQKNKLWKPNSHNI